MADDKTTDGFAPPAAKSLPQAALDSATKGANMLDAIAGTMYGRNLLAHALVQLQRDGWLRDGAEGPQMAAHGKLPVPPDRRPYRKMSEAGGFEQTVYSIDPSGRVTRLALRQVGWQGQSGAFYALEGDADPKAHEPGSYAPMCITAHADDCAPEDLIALVAEAGA